MTRDGHPHADPHPLDRRAMEALDLYRISPGVAGWVLEIVRVPATLLVFLAALSWAVGTPPGEAGLLVAGPPVLCLSANLTFFAHIMLERASARADILYLRNYAKPSFVDGAFTRDAGALQLLVRGVLLLVRGVLRPPFDVVSIFPPARDEDERRRDERLMRRRGIHHVFMVRTRDDAAWKEAVAYLMDRVRLVIVECHAVSGGFEWELAQLPAKVDPGRVILIAGAEDREAADRIKALLENGYRGVGRPTELPLIVLAPGHREQQEFKGALMSAVKSRSADWDEVSKRRGIALEIVLKVATILLTLGWWAAGIVATGAILARNLW